ncbi:hemerythrin domain-containing protein [Massilia endophytica]|uniref:hypothetical protein n=1 Tax=Massilia endophytica TaxID=2899220 RepID=UPI001E405B21|nr:hypothetical protein [Massilia endophytica]UGQ48775.1 hypothetical protein LSQ66_10035 [Massilia endophytica]
MDHEIALFAEVHDILLVQVRDLLGMQGERFNAGMAQLVEDLAEDFRLEEELMTALDYRGRDRHVAEHTELLGSLRSLAPSEARAALTWLPIWFQQHLANEDTELAHALQAKGGRRHPEDAARPVSGALEEAVR